MKKLNKLEIKIKTGKEKFYFEEKEEKNIALLNF
jgi:hypothetical protein